MSTNPHNFTENLMAELEAKQIIPRAKVWFLIRNATLWAVWFLSILVGAITLSVLWYSIQIGWYGFYEATHETWLDFMFDTVSFIWLPIFAFLIILAYLDMRHTRLGYRYPFWQIVGSSLFFSLVGGVIGVNLGIGSMVDKGVGEYMPNYSSQITRERNLWQAPLKGRLAGVVSEHSGILIITDVSGKEWKLETDGISGMDVDMLVPGMHVRLLGMASSSYFHICGVLPAVNNKDMEPRKMIPYQSAVRERLQDLRRQVKSEPKPCTDIPFVKNNKR